MKMRTPETSTRLHPVMVSRLCDRAINDEISYVIPLPSAASSGTGREGTIRDVEQVDQFVGERCEIGRLQRCPRGQARGKSLRGFDDLRVLLVDQPHA